MNKIKIEAMDEEIYELLEKWNVLPSKRDGIRKELLALFGVSQQRELFDDFSEWYNSLPDHERDEFSTVSALEEYLFKIIK